MRIYRKIGAALRAIFNRPNRKTSNLYSATVKKLDGQNHDEVSSALDSVTESMPDQFQEKDSDAWAREFNEGHRGKDVKILGNDKGPN